MLVKSFIWHQANKLTVWYPICWLFSFTHSFIHSCKIWFQKTHLEISKLKQKKKTLNKEEEDKEEEEEEEEEEDDDDEQKRRMRR